MTEQNGVERSSATEELRAMLDERGVEWNEHRHTLAGSMAIQRETLWGQPIDNTNGKPIPHVYHYRATEMGDGRLFLEAQLVTPEQDIAATLGAEDAYTREDVESAFVSGYSLGCLPVGSDPTWDQNEQTMDEHMAEWGWVRKEAALGSGTCHNVEEYPFAWSFTCSECGVHSITEGRGFNFCPNCGRKVVEPTTNDADAEVDV